MRARYLDHSVAIVVGERKTFCRAMEVVRSCAKMMVSTNCTDWSLGDSGVADSMFPAFTSK